MPSARESPPLLYSFFPPGGWETFISFLFGLALRQATGMVESILRLAELDWGIPDFSMLSRRQKGR